MNVIYHNRIVENFITYFISVSVILVIIFVGEGCCKGIELQKLEHLINNQILVAYRSDCGATTSYDLHVTFLEEDTDLNSLPSDVFLVGRGVDIAMEKVSIDTVKVHFLALEEPYKKRASWKGINFIYIEGSNIFKDPEHLKKIGHKKMY